MVRWHRQSAGLTLKYIADRTGTSPQTIQRLETGNMTLSMEWVDAIAEAMGLHAEQLVNPLGVAHMITEVERRILTEAVQRLRQTADGLEKRVEPRKEEKVE